MSPIQRRQFLQFAGSTLAAIGLSQLDIMRLSHRYAKVLAQNTPRKLALLVGINDYPDTSNFAPLQGCITDVELQRQLLIHRFGFNPKDIETLTDQQATRQGILAAFEEYLIKQAKPGDVVVFHYSGHGSRIADPDGDTPDQLNSTFVPVDSLLPSGFPDTGGVVQDIMGHTLFLLMSAVPTENLTVVLDSCYSGGGTRGNFRIRSREGGRQLQISPTEKTYQEQWLSRLKLSPQEFIKQRRAGVAKGVVIASAQRNQEAADTNFSGFSAGAFTYLMTQYLWQETGGVGSAIANITREIKPFSRQIPLAEIKPQSSNDRKPIYFTDTKIPPTEAVITEVSGNTAKVWLGGLDRSSLAAFDKGAVFNVIDSNARSSGKVRLASRKGLVAEATLEGTAQPGALLQEVARAIPSDLKLRIGLDSSLGGEMESAKQALQAINRIEAVPVPDQGEVHYLLGKITAADGKVMRSPEPVLLSQEKPAKTSPTAGSIGLFSPGKDEQLPGSFGEPGETAQAAVTRLAPKLKSLLAAHLLKMALNANSSRLKIAVAMRPETGNEVIAEAFTLRSGITRERNAGLSQRLKLGTPFQFRVTNEESRPLYLTILSVDPTGGLTVLFPHNWRVGEDVTRLDAGQTLLIPNPAKDEFQLIAQAKGIGEVLIVASLSPPKKALLALQSLAAEAKQERGLLAPTQPVEVIGDLLDDLSGTRGIGATERGVKTSEMAALAIAFEVI